MERGGHLGRFLARIGDAATSSLIDGLADPNPMVRALAARALARMGSRAHTAVPALIIALDDEDVGVRRNAARGPWGKSVLKLARRCPP